MAKGLLVFGACIAMAVGSAQAQVPANAGCSNAKMKCANNYLKGMLGIEGKAAKGGVVPDAIKIGKTNDKYSGLPLNKSCIEKADVKFGATCPQAGDAGLKTEMDALIGSLKTQLYVNMGPTNINPCFAAQTKCVANLAKGLIGADSKALKGGLFTDDAVALPKVLGKFDDTNFANLGKGCMQKLDAPTKACTTSGLTGQAASVEATVVAFINRATCEQSPTGAEFSITTGAAVGTCGTTDGTVNPALICGSLYIGGGAGSVPYGAIPAGTSTAFNLAGGKNRVCPRTAAETGSNRNCSDVGCFFGSPLPIVNGTLSTCVDNAFLTKGFGELKPSTGAFLGDVLLGSTVTVTGNSAQPCPKCVGGFCSPDAFNPGTACTPDSASGESHDCTAAGPALPTFAVSLSGITTGVSTATDAGGIFCPSQPNAGAFGDPAVTTISEIGSPAGDLTSGPAGAAKLASVYCIPATGNLLIDGSADLPGPGAISLNISADVN